MESDRFDQIIRSLSAAPSRRGMLQVAATGVLAAIGWDAAADAKRKKKKKKKKKTCKKPNIPCGKQCCSANQVCSGGQCRTPECRRDRDCRDEGKSCQQGRCQAICPPGACPGCNSCLARLREDGIREQVCSGPITISIPPKACNTDADCPITDPLCLNLAPNEPCTTRPCGTCVNSLGTCEVAPECVVDGDCTDKSEKCVSAECQPVCAAGTCPNNCFCAVEFLASGSRQPLCASTIVVPVNPTSCATGSDCGATETCLRTPPTSCTQAQCGECAIGFTPCQ